MNIDQGFSTDVLSLNDINLITSGTIDPTISTGFEAPQGSLYLKYNSATSGAVYVKFGPNNVDWIQLGASINDQYLRVSATDTTSNYLQPKLLGGTGITIVKSAAGNETLTINATSTGTVTSISTVEPAAGLTVTGGPVTTSGTLTFALTNDIGAIEALNTNGILTRTATDTWISRTITGTAGQITITNGSGVAGNPTINLIAAGTAGTYTSVTTDSFGRVTAGTTTQAWDTITGTPTTLAGYGITNAQLLDADLTAIAALTGTAGNLRTNGAGVWSVDSSTPVTSVYGRTGAVVATEGDYSLTQLSDTIITTPTTGQVLSYDGTNWTNVSNSLLQTEVDNIETSLGAIVNSTGQLIGSQFTTYNSTIWPTSPASIGAALSTLATYTSSIPSGTGTVTSVAATGSTGLTVSGSPITTTGTISLTLDTGLQNLASFATTGLVAATGTNTWTSRTITGTVNQIEVVNGDGVANNPTLSIANNIVLPGTGAVTLPRGTNAQQPTATDAQIRYNTSSSNYEVSISGQWYPITVQNTSQTAASSLIFDDMISGDTNNGTGAIMHGSSLNWINNLAGTGSGSNNSSFGVDATQRAIGVVTVETGTTTTGRSALTLGDAQILFGYTSFSCEWRVAHNALGTAIQHYNSYVGFFDNSNAAGDAIDGVYFKYSFNISPNWQIVTSSNSVRTITTTSIPVANALYQKLRIDVNDTGTLATYYIGGVSVGTIATNIPTGAGRYTGLGWKIEKTAGTTNRIAYMDYISVGYTYTTPR